MLFAVGAQASIKGGKVGIVSCGGEGAHEEALSQSFSTTLDTAPSTAFSAVIIIRRNTGERCDLGTVGMAQFRQANDETQGAAQADPLDRAQQIEPLRQFVIVANHLLQIASWVLRPRSSRRISSI